MLILRPPVDLIISMLALLEPGQELPTVTRPGSDGEECPAANAVEPSGPSFGAAIDAWRRQSGIPRPSSVARANITAALVCRSLLAEGQWNPSRVAVVAASATSAASTAVRFEMRGLTEGWHAVDPLLLPSTLLSALPTQVAMALGARALAVACAGGLLGVFNAIEIAALTLLRDDADAVFVVLSEEQTPVQQVAHERLGWAPVPGEFASGFVMRRGGQGVRLGFIAYGNSAGQLIPEDWAGVPRLNVAAAHGGPSIESVHAFASALSSRHDRVVVTGTDSRLGGASVGFERVH